MECFKTLVIKNHLDDSILQNHSLLKFKLYLCKSRSYDFVCLKSLLLKSRSLIASKKIAESNANKLKSYLLKWNILVTS